MAAKPASQRNSQTPHPPPSTSPPFLLLLALFTTTASIPTGTGNYLKTLTGNAAHAVYIRCFLANLLCSRNFYFIYHGHHMYVQMGKATIMTDDGIFIATGIR